MEALITTIGYIESHVLAARALIGNERGDDESPMCLPFHHTPPKGRGGIRTRKSVNSSVCNRCNVINRVAGGATGNRTQAQLAYQAC